MYTNTQNYIINKVSYNIGILNFIYVLFLYNCVISLSLVANHHVDNHQRHVNFIKIDLSLKIM